MTTDQFNDKWGAYLEDGFYGLIIEHEEVIKYLDAEFEKEVRINPNFIYSQIKMKWGTSRVYADSDNTDVWESTINNIINK